MCSSVLLVIHFGVFAPLFCKGMYEFNSEFKMIVLLIRLLQAGFSFRMKWHHCYETPIVVQCNLRVKPHGSSVS